MSQPIIIDYYSDVLCVWAWIAQRRIDELHQTLAEKIQFRYHYIDIFGDAVNKIPQQWQDKDSFEGFSKHVINSAADYLDKPIHQNVWLKTRPNTSANVHLLLKAAELVLGVSESVALALRFRQAFFNEAIDISNLEMLLALTEQAGFESGKVNQAILNGTAMAALMQDYQQARALTLKGSPSYIIDNGRQVLYGNVGYRVLLANIEEHLRKPEEEASWC